MEQSDIDHLAAVFDAVGPKRVKTVDVEVEAHSLKELLAAADRFKRKPVLFSDFPVAIAKPKHECVCDLKADPCEEQC